ncbi:hypothetical protein FACS1894132_03030 [Clostridia bacterium]|nr:hypothetical protein FACS1894132_03030 [Clostridia bacterium]
MLKGLLEKEKCAECRLCCSFDEYDVWEVPVFTDLEMEKIKVFNSNAEFFKWGNIFRFKITPLSHGELMSCPALTENGCALGENKPFECAVWPFRVMEIGGDKFICVASFCEAVFTKSLSDIISFLKDGLADKMFNYANFYPDIIKPFNEDYIPLMINN